jgi:hypothetical protein
MPLSREIPRKVALLAVLRLQSTILYRYRITQVLSYQNTPDIKGHLSTFCADIPPRRKSGHIRSIFISFSWLLNSEVGDTHEGGQLYQARRVARTEESLVTEKPAFIVSFCFKWWYTIMVIILSAERHDSVPGVEWGNPGN